MRYQTVLFDLDGTLTDPKLGITKSVAYSLKEMLDLEVDINTLTKFIGPPLKDSYMTYYELSEAEAYEAIEQYRVYFKDKGIYENKIYDGIEALLKELKSLGMTLIVATSKPTVFAEIITKHFKIDTYFSHIVGSNLDGSRTKKAEVIQEALNLAGIMDTSKVVMIGDREHDIIGAKTLELESIGVEYGYGSKLELQQAGANYIVSDIKSLRDILIR